MVDEKSLVEYTDIMSCKEIEKIRKNYNDNKKFYEYLLKTSKKITNKIIFPYFRFELLFDCLKDIKDNHKEYSNIKITKKFNLIFDKLQKICVCLNIALCEFYEIVSEIKS